MIILHIANLQVLKKPLKIDDPLQLVTGGIRKGHFGGGYDRVQSFSSIVEKFDNKIRSAFRKFIFGIFFFTLCLTAFAPSTNAMIIAVPLPVNAFSALIYATGMVETMGNVLAYNEFENAVGIFQIRQVRVDHYNRKTGSNYTLADMFNYSISEKVYLYFASHIGPYNFEKIAKAWNGSGPMTELYWKRIKTYLQ